MTQPYYSFSSLKLLYAQLTLRILTPCRGRVSPCRAIPGAITENNLKDDCNILRSFKNPFLQCMNGSTHRNNIYVSNKKNSNHCQIYHSLSVKRGGNALICLLLTSPKWMTRRDEIVASSTVFSGRKLFFLLQQTSTKIAWSRLGYRELWYWKRKMVCNMPLGGSI